MIKLQCENCNKTHTFDDEEVDFECVCTDPDRQMGAEHCYSGKIEFSCDCGEYIEVEFIFYEYPAMCVNHTESPKTSNCIVNTEPDYQAFLSE